MSLNLNLGNRAPAAATNTSEKPKADRWLNIGYPVETAGENGETKSTFVALPLGLALDTMQVQRGSGQMAAASNALLASLDAAVAEMEPGQERLFPIGETGLFVQLRRVKAEQAIASNPLVKTFKLVA